MYIILGIFIVLILFFIFLSVYLIEENKQMKEENEYNEIKEKNNESIKDNPKKMPQYSPQLFDDRWRNSIYNYKNNWVNANCNGTLFVFKSLPLFAWMKTKAINYQMVLYCKMATPTKKGVKLLLEDPYGQHWTEPIAKLPEPDAYGLVGRILIVNVSIEDDLMYVKSIKRTVYTFDDIAS